MDAIAEQKMDITSIEARRKRFGVSIDALCRKADLSSRSYYYFLKGEATARPETLKRLRRSLEQARRK